MARKKKQVAKTPKIQKNINTSTQSLSYQGKVKIQVLNGKKVIATKNYTNSGLPNLFKYISHALAGNHYASLRPCKLRIFKCNPEGDFSTPADFNWDTAVENKQLIAASPYVAYDATPVVQKTAAGYTTTFRFKVPLNWLFIKSFNVIGLFNEHNEACAYYLFTADSAWDLQDYTEAVGNYSLIIEWAMEVSNK